MLILKPSLKDKGHKATYFQDGDYKNYRELAFKNCYDGFIVNNSTGIYDGRYLLLKPLEFNFRSHGIGYNFRDRFREIDVVNVVKRTNYDDPNKLVFGWFEHGNDAYVSTLLNTKHRHVGVTDVIFHVSSKVGHVERGSLIFEIQRRMYKTEAIEELFTTLKKARFYEVSLYF